MEYKPANTDEPTQASEENYLARLVDCFEKENAENKNHPFKIVDIVEKGFIIKTRGLFAYISFSHMPWTYSSISPWRLVFPYLQGKVLFGKVYKFQKEPLSISLDGKIPQFRKKELTENHKYKGIVINKTHFGVFVDIGYHFNWECGSIVALLHISNFENESLYEKTNPGDTIELLYWGMNENEHLIVGLQPELREWYTGEIDNFVGQIHPVEVLTTEKGDKKFMIHDRYVASLPITEIQYPDNLAQIKRAVKKLINGDVIHCVIAKVKKNKRTLQLIWNSIPEIEAIGLRPRTKQKAFQIREEHKIINRINPDAVEKIQLLGKTVKVEVIKKEEASGRIRTKYIVENKYSGRLNFFNDAIIITNKLKERIEKNLQDGEILDCEVLSIENNVFKVRWTLAKGDLFRFLRE